MDRVCSKLVPSSKPVKVTDSKKTLAYYDRALITAVSSFMVQAPRATP